MMKQKEDIEKIGNRSETAKVNNEGLMASKPSVSIKYHESIHLETKCMLKGTDQENFASNKLDDQMKILFTYGLGEVMINNGNEGFGGYLSVYFGKEFGTIREILARVPNQDQRSNLDIPARTSYQCDFGESSAPNLEVASTKGKEKIEHFGVKLEEEDHDRRQFHPTQPNKGPTLNNGIKIKEEETSSTSSEDLVIV
ncbi:hypothetical protein Tco_1071734 [Tanacetum coccineum]